MQNDNERMWQQMANNSDKVEEVAKNTIELVDRKLEENLEATEERMAILTAEIHGEISELRKEGENNNQKLIQTELDVNRRISDIEKIHSAQIGVVEREQAEMKIAQSTLSEKCEEVSVKVDAIKHQVSNDKDQLTERQQREFNDIRDEMHRLRTLPNILSGLTHLEGREQIDFRAYVKNPLEFLEWKKL